jgi:hypothetical protein
MHEVPGSVWAKQLLAGRPTRIVTVALANKATRVIHAQAKNALDPRRASTQLPSSGESRANLISCPNHFAAGQNSKKRI